MERDDFACTICGDDQNTLNVHHCYYGKRKDPWDYDNEHLITLCQTCHLDVEKKREEILKTMNWEIPIETLHRIATIGFSMNRCLFDSLAGGLSRIGDDEYLERRAHCFRDAANRLIEMAEELELEAIAQ